MARRVFYSFHYTNDNWRASQVRNIGSVEGNKPATDNDWEEVKRGGDKAVLGLQNCFYVIKTAKSLVAQGMWKNSHCRLFMKAPDCSLIKRSFCWTGKIRAEVVWNACKIDFFSRL